jgi:hypothetical protein
MYSTYAPERIETKTQFKPILRTPRYVIGTPRVEIDKDANKALSEPTDLSSNLDSLSVSSG